MSPPLCKTRKRGFSLTELLAALAVAAVLLGILLPLAGRQRQAAQAGRCAGNLRQLGVALTLYATENNGYLLPCYIEAGTLGETVGARLWYQALHYANPATYKGEGILPNANPNHDPRLLTVYNCPSNPDRIGHWGTPSYAYSGALGMYRPADSEQKPIRIRLTNLDEPSRVVAMVDAGLRTLNPAPPNVVCYRTEPTGTFEWRRSVHFDLHPGRKANFLLVDGHVEAIPLAEVERRFADKTLLWSRNNLSGTAGRW
ncbi:MAG TPA: prepilin-type N-terminal cleavage/methylation domain-containing protein [Chthoniobacteraceae bacterium]|nr:prepilin-type N-terminal cleavage/methylation domain-containing protein [Chthoniobacteraceae bacterium]